MKRYFVLVGLFVALMCSCGNRSSQQDLEKQRHDSIEAAERESEEGKRMEEDSFTTSKGTFPIKKVLNHWYDFGVDNGASDKSLPHPRKYFAGAGTETKFKDFWVSWYGIPNNDKARETYNDALKKYIQGYEDGWNF